MFLLLMLLESIAAGSVSAMAAGEKHYNRGIAFALGAIPVIGFFVLILYAMAPPVPEGDHLSWPLAHH